MLSNNSFRLVVILVLVVLLSTLYAPQPQARAAGRSDATAGNTAQLKVVTSISPLADLVENVGGKFISVSHFVPLNVDPHTYEPTFSSLKTVGQAEVIFLNGDGLDRAARENLAAIKKKNCRVVDLSQFIPASRKNGVDPHYWLDLSLVEYYVEGVAATLSTLAPSHRKDFRTNADRYLERIRDLDARYLKAGSQLPAACKKVVLYHNAWTYTATRYGFETAGIIETSGTNEPSARQLARLIVKARSLSTRAIVAEPGNGSRILMTVKEEARIPVVLEMVEDSLRQSPSDTYLGMMEANLALLCKSICGTRPAR